MLSQLREFKHLHSALATGPATARMTSTSRTAGRRFDRAGVELLACMGCARLLDFRIFAPPTTTGVTGVRWASVA